MPGNEAGLHPKDLNLKIRCLAASVLLCLSGSAFAEFQYASAVTQTNQQLVTVTGSVANLVGAPNGTTVTYTGTAGADRFFQLRFDFANPINADGASPSFILYGLVVTGTGQVRHVTWSIDTANSGDPQIFGLNRNITSAAEREVLLSVNAFSPAFVTTTGYQSLFIDFTIVNSGDSITIDAISNPEPGTLALFGVGALALAGFAERRRRAAKAAKRT